MEIVFDYIKNSVSLLLLLVSFFGNAQGGEALFKSATTAYNDGSYKEAIGYYLKILETGEHSVAVYFNLGNSYYKLNQIAPSIYYYEKALLLKPNDIEVKNNLGYAQNMTMDAIEKIPETYFLKIYKKITTFLSFDQWSYLSILFMLLFVGLYIAFYYLRYATQKRVAFISSISCLVVTIVAVIFALLEYKDFNREQPAIVFSKESVIKSEPNNRGEETFRLHQGAKVNVLNKLNNWKKIQLADGKTGWILAKDIKMLKSF